MLLNVNTNTGDPRLVKEAIQEADPDFLVLEEISDKWLEHLEWLKSSYPYSITKPRNDNFGIGLFSKHLLTDGEVVNIGVNIPSIRASIKTGRYTLLILATHPTPPTSFEYSKWRNKQLDQLPKFIDSKGYAVLVGDLNVTPWNSHFRKLLKQTGLLDSSVGQGIHPTWPNGHTLLRIPIDHILVSPSILVAGRWVGKDVGSDHFPVILDFRLQPMNQNSVSTMD